MITTGPIEATRELVHELSSAVGHVDFSHLTRLLYSTDASIYQMLPVGVVFPRHADEVVATVEIANRHQVPILPRGGGSSLAGQAVGHALVIDFSRYMNSIMHVDPEAKTVKVQPGMTLGNMNRALATYGLQYGPDPASADRANIGGVVGNNSTGAHSIVYGMTADHVLAVRAVLADGSAVTFDALNGDTWEDRARRAGLEGQIYASIPGIIDTYADQISARYPKTFRHVSGYRLNYLLDAANPNMAQLLVGSEGTLAVTTHVLLNLVDVPKKKRLGLVHFSSLRAALEAVPTLLETNPSAVELIDKFMLDLARDKVEYRRLLTFVEGDPEIILIVEYAGSTDAEVDAGLERLKATVTRIGHRDPLVIVADDKGQANVWYVRKVGLGILMSIRGDAKPIPFIEDAAVPVEHLADYVTRIIDICHQAGVEEVAMYAHASAGCVHVRPLVNLKTADGVRQIREIGQGSLELCLEYGGTISGEHGDGLVRGEFVEGLYGSELTQAFREVKGVFDPQNRMNPGKIVDPPSMNDESLLRFGTGYATPLEPVNTVLDFSADGGFAGAVEMCNGAGVCRKTMVQGVMCPSYIATMDEAHSTRGRANALRAAMKGELDAAGMASEALYDVLDLCLSCKACKAECPSAVDMAKLKAEFLHGYQQEHGVTLRTRLFANIAQLNKLGQPFWPVTNLLMAGPLKWAMTALGVHKERTLPKLAPQTFSAWFKRWQPTSAPREKEVVFFHDTFTQHNDPRIGQAAVNVLAAAGYAVTLVEKRVCCGRPAISKGLLDQARASAETNVALLAPYAERGIPIVGVEPSCIGAITDEYPDLVRSEAARRVAEHAMLIDDFLAGLAAAGSLSIAFDDQPREVLFHGHCNQKALYSTAGTRAMLAAVPNLTLTEVESSCCGMAGSFGYEAEHYEMSIKLAERTLAPAVRQADADTIICATGTSCRDQIHHTTDREILHPIEVVAGALR